MTRVMLAVCLLSLSASCNTMATRSSGRGEEEPEAPGKRCVTPLPAAAPPAAAPSETCPADPVFGGVVLKTGTVRFIGVEPPVAITVELARTAAEKRRGLMYRRRLPDGSGMLFVEQGPPRVQSFWMRNTCIPLDMIFIDEDGIIAGIIENVPPLTETPRSIPCPVKYVLEVPAGWSRGRGIRPGQPVALPE